MSYYCRAFAVILLLSYYYVILFVMLCRWCNLFSRHIYANIDIVGIQGHECYSRSAGFFNRVCLLMRQYFISNCNMRTRIDSFTAFTRNINILYGCITNQNITSNKANFIHVLWYEHNNNLHDTKRIQVLPTKVYWWYFPISKLKYLKNSNV